MSKQIIYLAEVFYNSTQELEREVQPFKSRQGAMKWAVAEIARRVEQKNLPYYGDNLHSKIQDSGTEVLFYPYEHSCECAHISSRYLGD